MECRSIGFPMVKIVTSSGSDQAFRIETRVCHISQFLPWKGSQIEGGSSVMGLWISHRAQNQGHSLFHLHCLLVQCELLERTSNIWTDIFQNQITWCRVEKLYLNTPLNMKSVPHWNKGMKRTRYVLVDEGSSNTGNQNDVCMCRWQHATCALTGETIPLHKLQLSRVKYIDRDWLTKCMIDHIDHVRSNGFEHFRRLYSKPFFRTTNPHSSYQFAGVKGVNRGWRKNALPRATKSAYHLIGSVWCPSLVIPNSL